LHRFRITPSPFGYKLALVAGKTRLAASGDEIMEPGTRNRLRIAALIYSMTNAVIFGAGIITVLNVSALRANAPIWIPVVVVASLILAAPFAWLIAPRLQARYDRRHFDQKML
jgi:hypothetical protein